jgi:AraC-like DNA-binding protein
MSIEASPNALAASRARCVHRHHLDPADSRDPRQVPTILLEAAREKQAHVLVHARDEIQRLFSTLCRVRYGTIIADCNGIVTWRYSLPADAKHLDDQGIRVGTDWRECQEGTNGIGTCLAVERPLSVHQNEHFKRRHTGLSSSAALVRAPTGDVAAVIGAVTGDPELANGSHILALAAISATASAIEECMFRAAYPDCWILLLSDNGCASQRAFLALDASRRVIGADYYAQQSLGIKTPTTSFAPVTTLDDIFSGGELCRASRGASARTLSLRRMTDSTPWNCVMTSPAAHRWPSSAGASQYFRLYSSGPGIGNQGDTKEAKKGGLSTRASQRVREYISSHLAYDMPLEDLASIAEVSLSHFSREFKRSFGLSPHQYIVVKRVERAADLITTTRSFFSDIALQVGFSDQSHFSRSFRHVLNMTPRDFKRTLPNTRASRKVDAGLTRRELPMATIG